MPDSFEEMWAAIAPVGRVASGGYFRQPFTSAETELRGWFVEQAQVRDLSVEADEFGNLVAWWGGPATAEQPGILTGSHLDSVLDGGAFDGPLGVVSSYAAVDALRESGFTPARPIGIAAFVEEEGSRFGLACLGSRLATGATTWEQARELRDRDGVFLADAMASSGLEIEPARHDPTWHLGRRLAAAVELHVEQGRGLVDLGRPVGAASAIWPHGRYRFEFTGQPNHAGTTRMEDRHDPMLTCAMTTLAANKQARLSGGRATFGRVEVGPNSTNSVPATVTAWLDARCESVQALSDLVAAITRQAGERAERDGTALTVTAESVSDEVTFDRGLLDPELPTLATQAGHDAGTLAAAGVPTAMLFVRNPSGISHSPDEHAEPAACLAGVDALATALRGLAS